MSAFTQLLDRGLPAEGGGALAAWNPAMDLLALALEGQLAVHRLNWQRLWWTSPEAPVTALEWRPDGKQLAVGLEDGTLLLLNTEDGEVEKQRKIAPHALVALSWTEVAPAQAAAAADGDQQQQQQGEADGSSSSGGRSGLASSTCGAAGAPGLAAAHLAEDRARRMFAPPPAAVPSATAGLAVGYATCGKRGSVQSWPAEPSRLAVLAVATAGAGIALCTSELVPLAMLRLPALLGCPSASVLRLCVAPSLRQLAVCWQEGGEAGHKGPLRLATIGTGPVGAHAAQLHRLGLAVAQVEDVLHGCMDSAQAASTEWQSGQRELDESRGKLASLMSDYGSTSDPASELQGLLATGAVGGALQQYITTTLGEPGLKRLARAVDAAVCAVHNLLTDHLQPQLEQLAFRLGELRGLALCLPWRRVTGLKPEQVGAAEQTALRLVLAAEAVRRRVVQAGAQYRTFFSWLLILLRRMQEDASEALVGYPRSHTDAVSEFLGGQYRRDAVGPLLGDPDSSEAGSDDSDCDSGASGASKAAAASAQAGTSGTLLDLVMEALGKQPLVQAADSTASPGGGGGAAAAGGPPGSSLGQLLAELHVMCSTAFNRTSDTISPKLQLVDSLTLGPSPCALATSYQPLAGAEGTAAAAVAVAWEGQPQVLVLRGTAQEAAPAAAAVEAAVVVLPQGSSAVDVAFYKDGQVAVLLAGDEGTPCRLALLPQHALHFAALPAELLAESDALQLAQMLLESGAGSGGTALPDDCRQRVLPYPRVDAPLAVSASRGVGCLMAGTQRVLLYDLEEDEEEEEEEGEEDLVDAHEGHDMDSDAGFESPLSR